MGRENDEGLRRTEGYLDRIKNVPVYDSSIDGVRVGPDDHCDYVTDLVSGLVLDGNKIFILRESDRELSSFFERKQD